MATSSNTKQYKNNISLARQAFMSRVVLCEDLTKKDLRVLLHLMTHLDAVTPKEISKKNISIDLNMSKNDVCESMDRLEMFEIIDRYSTGSVKNGYILLF